jgi:septum formation protein
MQKNLVFLASQSPRRKALLETLGISPIVIPATPGIDTEALEVPLPKEDPTTYVQRVALAKRDAGHRSLQDRSGEIAFEGSDLLLAADTTVALDGEIFGKPQSGDHAVDMLRRLSARTHQVHTAVCITRLDGARERVLLVSSAVTFAPLPEEWILEYVRSGEPMDKAGAYGLQGSAQCMIPTISGSYSGIIGLPLYETWQALHFFSGR